MNRENIYLTQEILHLEQQIWGPGIAITDLKSYFFQKWKKLQYFFPTKVPFLLFSWCIAWKWQIERVHILIIEYKGDAYNNSESWMGFFKSLFLDRSFQKSWSHNLNGWSSAGVVLEDVFWLFMMKLNQHGKLMWCCWLEKLVCCLCMYILAVNLRLSGSWDGWWF